MPEAKDFAEGPDDDEKLNRDSKLRPTLCGHGEIVAGGRQTCSWRLRRLLWLATLACVKNGASGGRGLCDPRSHKRDPGQPADRLWNAHCNYFGRVVEAALFFLRKRFERTALLKMLVPLLRKAAALPFTRPLTSAVMTGFSAVPVILMGIPLAVEGLSAQMCRSTL